MKKWKLFLTIATLFSLSTTYASATCYQEVNPCDLRQYGQWVELEFDLLYWKPCIDNLDLAAILTEKGGCKKVEYKDLCSDWQTGIRASLLLPNLFYGWDFSASYYRLNYEDSTKQTFTNADNSNGIISPLTHKDDSFTDIWEKGSQSLEIFYHEWDLLLAYDVYSGPCHRFTPYFGIAALFLEQVVDAEFSKTTLIPAGLIPKQVEEDDTAVEVEWKSDYSGVGIRMGAEYECNISNCILFFTKANVSLLGGESTTNNEQIRIQPAKKNEILKVIDDDNCHFVTGYHIAAGLSYSSCICGWDYGVRLGYEFVNWHNVHNHRVFSGNNLDTESGHSSSNRTRTLGFHGLFFGLTAIF